MASRTPEERESGIRALVGGTPVWEDGILAWEGGILAWGGTPAPACAQARGGTPALACPQARGGTPARASCGNGRGSAS